MRATKLPSVKYYFVDGEVIMTNRLWYINISVQTKKPYLSRVKKNFAANSRSRTSRSASLSCIHRYSVSWHCWQTHSIGEPATRERHGIGREAARRHR